MAENKKQKRSGYDAPAIGRPLPAGTTLKRRKDGVVEIVTPKKKKK